MKVFNQILDFAERKLHVNVRYYLKNTGYLLFLEIILTIISIAFTVAFTRIMSKEDFGIYNYVFSVIGILAIASLQGINISMTRSVSRGFDGDFMAGTKARVKWSFIGMAGMFAVSLYYYFQSSGIFLYMLLGTVFFTGYTALGTYSAFLYGKSRFKLATKLSIAFQVVTIGGGAMVIYFVRDLFWILFSVLFLSTIMQLALLKYLRSRVQQNENRSPDMIIYGKHLSLNQIAINIIPYTDRVIIGGLLGFVDVAIYSIALQVTEKIKRFLNPLTNVIFPNLSKMEAKNAYAVIRHKVLYFTLLGAVIAIAGIILSPLVIVILFTKEYATAVFYTQVLFVSVAFVPPALVLYTLLQAQRDTRKLYYYNTSASLIEIVLTASLIILWGLWGAVLARLVTRIYMLAVLLRLTSWKEPTTP